MAASNDLESRLDAEMAAVTGRIEELRAKAVRAHEERQARYAEFVKVAAELSEKVGKPRLESLMKRFPEAKSTKLELRHGRGVNLNFDSDLARVSMEVAVHPLEDSGDLVVTYDLSILPIFLEFEQHAELRQPLSKVDHEAVARWLDDRLVAFAKTYFALQFTEQYQRRNIAVDPVAGVRFPTSFAAGTVERGGVTYHFLSAQTKTEFERDPEAYVSVKSKAKG
jgi:YHS domain-containing protein